MPKIKQIDHSAIFKKITGRAPEHPKGPTVCRGPEKTTSKESK